MNAIIVKRSESGCYTVGDATALEDWAEVQANADHVEKIESLMGWGDYTAAYAVQIDGGLLTYFVAEVD